MKIAVHSKNAAKCKITTTPKISGFPRTLRCHANFSTVVTLPSNSGTAAVVYKFAVNVINGSKSSPKKTVSVTEATDVAHVGTTLYVHDYSGNVLAVTVTGFTDPAAPAYTFDAPAPGKRLVTVNESILNLGPASSQGDAYSYTAVVGSDGQGYEPDFSAVSGCTDFNDGEYTLLSNAAESGCLTYALPNGVNIARVQYSIESSVDTAQWNT